MPIERIVHIKWQFGGWLAGWPASVQWGLLTILFLLAVAATVLSYCSARLAPWQWATLLTLRVFFLFGVILCLANPTKVERLAEDPEDRTLTVIIDHSESMMAKDNRGHTRLEAARRKWEPLRKNAEKYFQQVRFGSFADKYLPASSWETALNTKTEGETRLYDTLLKVLTDPSHHGRKEIVCLTDGLDTTSTPTDVLITQALASRAPLWFVVGENRKKAQDFIQLRDSKVPTEAMRRTTFACETVLEAFLNSPREISVSLWQDGRKLREFPVSLLAGHTLLPLRETITAGDPGEMKLEWRLNDESEAEHEVRITGYDQLEILYYQGALDWGFRAIHTLLKRDPSYHFTALFNPRLGVRLPPTADTGNFFMGLPDDAGELAKFQVIIVENLFANQLSPAQQEALKTYAKNGGALFFILPDKNAAAALENTKIADILPVIFESPALAPVDDIAKIRSLRDETPGMLSEQERARSAIQLQAFAFPEDSPLAELMKTIDATGNRHRLTPKFASYAPIQQAKPGAEILGIHPHEQSSTGHPRILLAAQRYGNGRVATMATDSLWRWKLSEPSDSKDVEIFWQQWILWLAQSTSQGPQFIHPPSRAVISQSVPLAIDSSALASLQTSDPYGKILDLTTTRVSENDSWQAEWKPDSIGRWQITARDPEGRQARIFVRVYDQPPHIKDLANFSAEVERLRKLGEATGGGLIEYGLPRSWSAHPPLGENLLPEKSYPLWNSWTVLLLCLTFYSTELLLRRRWQRI